MAQDCPFCRIIVGRDPGARILFHTDAVTAFFPSKPATRGHTLVVPNRHVAVLTDLTVDESRVLGEQVRRVGRALQDGLRPEGLSVIQSNGAVATQTVPHVHFHVLPRWASDRLKIDWPRRAAEDNDAQDLTLDWVKSCLPPAATEVSPEDRRQHLTYEQAVVTRMSQASSSAKTWLLPIVTLTFGYALTHSSWLVAALGSFAVLIFGLLDANYLKQERAFRRLYDQTKAGGQVPAFAMDPSLASPDGSKVNYWPDGRDLGSWSILPFYGPLLLLGLGIGFWLRLR